MGKNKDSKWVADALTTQKEAPTYEVEWKTPEAVERDVEQKLRDACATYVGEKYTKDYLASLANVAANDGYTYSPPVTAVGEVPFDAGTRIWTDTNTANATDWKFPSTVDPKNPHYYASMAISPTEYIMANNLQWCEANVVKYVSRWRNKGGLDDLKKAQRYIEQLIEQESK